ncbi:MAG: carbamoyl-phosphate synthase large subunit, partial [Gemmatimonadota bacterium]
RRGWPVERVRVATAIDPWFLHQLADLAAVERAARARGGSEALDAAAWREIKGAGFADARLAELWEEPEAVVRGRREAAGVRPAFKVVDTCAGEFEARTPYFYSSYDPENEAVPLPGPKTLILGGGPNRIGQGIEFDYCCVQAALALREIGHRVIMVNCNPETVSTDYDLSDRLYFEPLTFEDVWAIVAHERPDGVIVQYGGQTPLKLAAALHAAGVPIIGTPPEAIDRCEDRDRFGALLRALEIPQPRAGFARTAAEARREAARVGYPVLLRPSYVLGGRGMVISPDADALDRELAGSLRISGIHPLLIDEYLTDAVEIDVDCIADGEHAIIGGVMQHIEPAGVHSGDSTCMLPAVDLDPATETTLRDYTRQLALALGVRGLMNVQFAVRDGRIYVLEVNPRASRTIPFVSKTVGVPLAKLGAQVMAGRSLAALGLTEDPVPVAVAVKAPVFVFHRFPGTDPLPGPEMRSTGEVIGLAAEPRAAYLKAMLGAGLDVSAAVAAGVLFALDRRDLAAGVAIAAELARRGVPLFATGAAWDAFQAAGIPAGRVPAAGDGTQDVVARTRGREFGLVVSTLRDDPTSRPGADLRRAALAAGTPSLTTLAAAAWAARALDGADGVAAVRSLQRWTAAGSGAGRTG